MACTVAIAIPAAAQQAAPENPLGSSDTTKSPMISGFERFARHDELSSPLAGSLLISELSCVGCHASEIDWLQPKRGPRLNGAGVQLNPAWIRAYLDDPQNTKPGATMPHVLSSLSSGERKSAINALVAFLGTQREPFVEIKAGGAAPVVHEFWKRGDADRGSKLYHTIGCVACHEPDADYDTVETKPSAIDELIDQLDPEEIADLGLTSEARRVESVPHGDLSGKYSLRSLTMMLLDPSKTRPTARMPSLRLTPAEAADIAAHLLRDRAVVEYEIESDQALDPLAEKGQSLFVQLRCNSCHDASRIPAGRFAKPLADLNLDAPSSCIENPAGEMPHYSLDAHQIDAIRSRLSTQGNQDPSAIDDVHFRMLQWNCYGCHRRDEFGGVGRYRKAYFETVSHVDLGDEGRLPPTLGGVGRKLLPKALASVFEAGTPTHRPYMKIRMPAYSKTTVESLVAAIPLADQADNASEETVFARSHAPSAAGRELSNTGCVGCHAFRGESLPGVIGIDLSGITDRVYPKWFHEFVLNPSEVKERTRMPTFFPAGTSNRPDLLDGDVDRQIAALWAYLRNLENESLPEKIEEARSANYELSPTDKPIVLRTFMEQAGTHAIAVGFPLGVHYAFDAEQVRLAVGWKGRFLDARGTWFERFTPPADPLGQQQVRFPAGPLLSTDGGIEAQFQGFRLDHDGVPIMLYRLGPLSIQDRIEPTQEGGLTRTIKLTGDAPAGKVFLRAHASKQLTASGPSAYTDERGLTVSLPNALATSGTLRRSGPTQQWLVPVGERDSNTVVLEYRW